MRKSISFIFLLVFSLTMNAQQKNILLIVVDDLNDWIGAANGHPQTMTPNLDKLAAKGVMFNNTSCASPVCNPSRTAFLSGRRPHETGITNNADGSFREDPTAWVRNLTSWPQYFGQQGFETVVQGKIFHTHGDSQGEFQKLGPGGQGCNAGSNVKTVTNTDLIWSESNQSLTATGDYKSAEWCGNYLKQNHNKPFLMACGIFRPHLPHHAPKQFYDNLPAIKDIILPPYQANDLNDTYGRSNKSLPDVLSQGGETLWKETVRAYLANVAFADACLGKLLDDLDKSQFKNNTIVVIVGDHGWHLGEKEHFQKFTMWERAIKTPMIIFDPMVGGKGMCNKSVSMMDIFPTLLELTNTPQPTYKTSGRSIATLVKNPNANWCGVALTTYSGENHSIRTDRYRYIKYSNGKEELYDHDTDPNEWTNVTTKANYSAVLSDHRTILNKMLNGEENPIANCATTGVNQAPTVALTAPVNNVNFNAPATVLIEATASDADGTISKVEFYNGATLLSTDNNAPYSYSWTNVANGTYTISAKAYDNKNASTYSGSRTITVGTVIVPPSDILDLAAVVNNCSVKLTWSDVQGEEGYRIRRKMSNDLVYINIGDVAANVKTFIDQTIDNETDYIYVVRPLLGGVAVASSNSVDVSTKICPITALSSSSESSGILVYPNPTSDLVHLSTHSNWKLISILGEVLEEGNGDLIQMYSYSQGIYVLAIENQTYRLVKE
jgi:arylsulfatase A-like enzyme